MWVTISAANVGQTILLDGSVIRATYCGLFAHWATGGVTHEDFDNLGSMH